MSSGVVVTFQVSCASSFSIGMLRNTARPTRPGAKSASPIQTPSPSPDREDPENDGGGKDGHGLIRPRSPAAPRRPSGASPASSRIARAAS